MTFGAIGGILLIIGAFCVYTGHIFRSMFFYLGADLCWLIMAIEKKDYIGGSLIIIGMLLGAGVFYKMNKGTFHKTIKKENKSE